MHASFHRTVEAAVQAAAAPIAFERVAYYALREQFSELELTAPSKDDGKDLQVRRLGSTREDVRVMVSLQKNWTSKLDTELGTIAGLDEGERPKVAVFVTNADPQEASISKRRDRALELGVGLQVVGRTGLAAKLNEPRLRWVAEYWLGLEPLRPRLLQSTAQFAKATRRLVPGFDAALIGRDDTIERIRELLWADGPQAPRLLVIEGAGGLGKTRLAVEAAARDLTTMVAPGTLPLPPEEIKDLPGNERAVLIVDDAHRCPDLSGVTALMRDERFDLTKLVLTIRPGMLERVLVNAGLEFVEREVIALDPLPRDVMAQLVRDWDIDNDRFATTVIDVSRGVPLIAHAMCETARRKGTFGGEDIVDVLNSRIANRLAAHEDGARAVAVALALASSATGDELGAYASAVTRLPPVGELLPHLELLADVGIAQAISSADRSGQPVLNYSIKPDLLAAALLATSLDATRGVRLKVQELLNLIGFSDGDRSVAAETPRPAGGPGTPNTDPTLARLTSTLVTHQVSLLAQAAAISNNGAVLDRLASAILASIPPDPRAGDWTIVFRLAEQVVGYAPRLFGELQIALTKQSTLRPSDESALWFESVDEVRRYEYEQFMSAALSTVEHHGAADPAAATELALTITALLAPHVRPTQEQHGRAGRAVKALVAPQAGERWADCIARRTRAIDAVNSWVAANTARNAHDNDKHTTMPGDATDTEGPPLRPAWRDSTPAALDALVALLDPVVEQTRMGSPESADVLVLSGTHLPEGDATERVLKEAASATANLFSDLPLDQFWETPDTLLRGFISLPRDLWGIGARGAPFGGGELPDSLREVLARCAREIETVFARRWAELPLWARYEIVSSVSHVRPVRTLKQRAHQGSPVARAAIKDPDVARLLVLAPTERDLKTSTREAKRDRHAADLARQLAREVDLDEAVELLRVVSVLKREWQMYDPMIEFVDEIAFMALEPGEVSALLKACFEEPQMAGADRLVAQLAKRHPQLVEQALTTRAKEATTPGVLIDVIPQLDDGRLRRALVERALEMIIVAQGGQSAATPEEIRRSERGSLFDAASGVVAGATAAGIKMTTSIVPDIAARTATRPLRRLTRAAQGVFGTAKRLGDGPGPDARQNVAAVPARGAMPEVVVATARRWVLMTWRLPSDASDAQGQAFPSEGWRTDALIRMGLYGPAGSAGDVLQRATYRARHKSDKQSADDDESTDPLSLTQMDGLILILARVLGLADLEGSDAGVSDWDYASAVVALAKPAPEQLSDVLAPWILRSDGVSRTWPMDWRHELSDMKTEDKVPLGVALKSRLDARLETIEFAETRDKEIAQFDVDRNLDILLSDSTLWRATIEGWITGPDQDLGRAAAVLAKSWRSGAWPELVDLMLTARPGEQLLTQVSLGLLPNSYGPDLAEELQPRLNAVARINLDNPAAQEFVNQTTNRLQKLLAEYESDAQRRRTGY